MVVRECVETNFIAIYILSAKLLHEKKKMLPQNHVNNEIVDKIFKKGITGTN